MYVDEFHHLVIEQVAGAVDLAAAWPDPALRDRFLCDLKAHWRERMAEVRRQGCERERPVVRPPRGSRPQQRFSVVTSTTPRPSQPEAFAAFPTASLAPPPFPAFPFADHIVATSSAAAALPGRPKAVVRLAPAVIDVDGDELDWEPVHQPCGLHPSWQRPPARPFLPATGLTGGTSADGGPSSGGRQKRKAVVSGQVDGIPEDDDEEDGLSEAEAGPWLPMMPRDDRVACPAPRRPPPPQPPAPPASTAAGQAAPVSTHADPADTGDWSGAAGSWSPSDSPAEPVPAPPAPPVPDTPTVPGAPSPADDDDDADSVLSTGSLAAPEPFEYFELCTDDLCLCLYDKVERRRHGDAFAVELTHCYFILGGRDHLFRCCKGAWSIALPDP